MKQGFDNDKYLKVQSEHIRERIAQFGNKLYLELGGKLFDDHHASRVLARVPPGTQICIVIEIGEPAEKISFLNANV